MEWEKYRFCSIDRRTKISICQKKETIVTGMQSEIFPENINIGTIEKKYILTIKPINTL
jgi:hypothetical protein